MAVTQNPGPEGHSFTFIDLFAGIGGLRRGFEAVGGRCVYTCEIDRFARKTYEANFQPEVDHVFDADIKRVDPAAVPDHDVLLAGFPCQPFSISGVSKRNSLKRQHGFNCKEEGNLFFELARVIEEKQPSAFLLENVKNLANHDKGKTWRIITDTLEDVLGYDVKATIVDAKAWVPQHRERVFIAGFREKCDFSFADFKARIPKKGPLLKTILHAEDGSEEPDPGYIDRNGKVLEKYVLSDHLWDYLQKYAEKHRAAGNGFGFGLTKPDQIARTLSARYFKDGSEILIWRGEGKNPRRLTPRECARLMGFEKPGGPRMKIPVSDTQAYKQFGNAVAVPAVEAVAEHMLPWILSAIAAGKKDEARAVA